MKSVWLSLLVIVLALGSVKAADPPKADAASGAAGSLTEQVKNNPDDPKVFNAWLNETFTAISESMDSAPKDAEKKLAETKEFVESLKPESAAGKLQVPRAKSIVTNFEETLELSRVSLADLAKQLEEKPDDLAILRKYTRKVSIEIGSIARAEPEKADQLMGSAKQLIEKLKPDADEKTKTQFDALERTLASIGSSIKHGHELAALIGKPAPVLNIEDWANGDALQADDLKGKVVLLDFWAIWCGPCVATFPHLREWQEHYADKGLVIIGMTQYYNFKWDEDAGKPVRGKEKDEVSHEDEQAMLKHFAEFHRLQHRFAIQTEGHSVTQDFAIKGIPQAVVIDRQGVVRLIRVGSGSKNAKAIHDMIEKLLADKPVAAK